MPRDPKGTKPGAIEAIWICKKKRENKTNKKSTHSYVHAKSLFAFRATKGKKKTSSERAPTAVRVTASNTSYIHTANNEQKENGKTTFLDILRIITIKRARW